MIINLRKLLENLHFDSFYLVFNSVKSKFDINFKRVANNLKHNLKRHLIMTI